MRKKTITALVAAVAGMAAFGSTAGPAAADDTNVHISYWGAAIGSPSLGKTCTTDYKRGVLGQYGASGYFIDGCTMKIQCPYLATNLPGAPRTVVSCTAETRTYIETETKRGDGVTQNARLRRFTAAGAVYGWSDKNCSGIDQCETSDLQSLSPGEWASVQCNGVRAARISEVLGTGPSNRARVGCGLNIRWRSI